MTRFLIVAAALAFALAGCSKNEEASSSMSKAKADTKAALESAKGAIVNAADAAKVEAQDAAERTKQAAAEARTSPAVEAAKVKASEIGDRTKELALDAKDKIQAGAETVSDKSRVLVDQAKAKAGSNDNN